jgi:hypothetical protein
MKHVSIRQALQHVADYPEPVTDDTINMPVYEMVSRTLFDIANRPDAGVRGSMTKANRARKMILDRMAGKRRAGTKPPTKKASSLEFVDLTGGELSAGESVQRPDGGAD